MRNHLNSLRFTSTKTSNFSPVRLELETKSLFEEKKVLTYNETGVSYEEFFEQNIDSYEILAKDFLEHQIDVSIN
jgi:hypothetical protein